MHRNVSLTRAVLAGVLVLGVAAGSGCSWFRKGNALYAADPAQRPLEVPPELGSTAVDAPAPGPVTASGTIASAAQASSGFLVPGTRDEVFNKVGDVLGGTPGLTIASRAQLLGAFDVSYEGSNFLVRVADGQGGAYVSAVDPRGLPASGDAPGKLIAALKTALAGN